MGPNFFPSLQEVPQGICDIGFSFTELQVPMDQIPRFVDIAWRHDFYRTGTLDNTFLSMEDYMPYGDCYGEYRGVRPR